MYPKDFHVEVLFDEPLWATGQRYVVVAVVVVVVVVDDDDDVVVVVGYAVLWIQQNEESKR